MNEPKSSLLKMSFSLVLCLPHPTQDLEHCCSVVTGTRLPVTTSRNYISDHSIQRAEILSPTTQVVKITPVRLKSQGSEYLQRKVHCAAKNVFIFFCFLKNGRKSKGCTACVYGFHYLGEFISAFAR